MAFCKNCGTQVDDSALFCPACGKSTDASAPAGQPTVSGGATELVMGIMAYLGLLVLVPILCGRQSRFLRFHANQGLVLCIISVLLNVIDRVAMLLGVVGRLLFLAVDLLELAVLALTIVGIVYVVQRREAELPVIGKIQILR